MPSLLMAHTVGGACSSELEHCERWSVTVQGPSRPAGQRPDNFPSAIAVSPTTVFAGVTAVNFNLADAYSSTASWAIAAYDLTTGAERWHAFRRSRVYDSLHDVAVSPDGTTVVATGGAYDAFPVGATNSRIVTVAYDAATGVERWSQTWYNNSNETDNGVVVAFAPDGHAVYVGGITMPSPGELDYVTIAYDAADGTQRWVQTYRGLGAGGTNSLYDLAVSPDGKQVYVTGESAGAREYEVDYATVAYDASTGSQLWASRSQPTFVDRAYCLAVDTDHVYVTGDSYTGPGGADYQALTVALRAGDGSVDWQQRLGGSGYNGGQAIAAGAGRVIVTTQSPSNGPGEGLTALTAAYDAATGQQLWVTALAEPVRSQLANDLSIAPDGRRVYLIASSRPAIPDTALDDQEVVAYNMIDGSTAWSVHLDSGTGNALTGAKVTVTPDGSSLLTLGQITRSANPLGPADQDIYDSLVVALPTGPLSGTITTVAGGMAGKTPGLLSPVTPMGVLYDGQGNIYFADLFHGAVRRIDRSGNVNPVAGTDTLGAGGDGGPATRAQLNDPMGVARDPAGNLYIADSLNNRVRRVASDGTISTFAGGGTAGVNNGDGMPATSASLSDPERVAVDPAGNVYIADVNHGRVRKVDTSGTITTFAGNGGFAYSGDGGPATSASFEGVSGMTWMPDGSLLIADSYNNRIRRVDSSGVITTAAGNGTLDSGDGGPASSAGVYNPVDVASDGSGGYWIAEATGDAVRHVDSQGIITTIAVPGLLRPQGVAAAPDGGVFISDLNARVLRWHRADGTNIIVAGNGFASLSPEGVPALDASLNFPEDVAFDSAGNMYVADQVNYVIERVSPDGVVTIVAGNGQPPCRSTDCSGFSNGDGGPAKQAILASPRAVAVDRANNLYIAEYESGLVRKVDTNGVISTYAGGGTSGLGDGGPATQAQLSTVYGLTIAPDDSLVIADTFNHRIRRVDSNGIIATVAGNGTAGYAGDSGPATSAELNDPTGITYDSSGNLYIADFSNMRVREVTADGLISTVAGNGQADTGGTGLGDGLPAILASLSGPYSVAVDNSGNLYISDQTDQRIRAVDTSGTMSTVTGNGKPAFSGDGGPAASGQVWSPGGMAVAPNGALYFADIQNSRIRAIGAPPVAQLTSVVSTKTHGNTGSFDVYLQQGSIEGIECRSDLGGNYTLIFTFENNLTNVGSATVSSGVGSVATSNVDSNDAHNYIVSLTGVTNAQTLTVSLSNVTDSADNFSPAVAGSMAVLIGDANGDGFVNSADISQTKSQSGQAVTSNNFREDVNADGFINSADISLVKSKSGTALP